MERLARLIAVAAAILSTGCSRRSQAPAPAEPPVAATVSPSVAEEPPPAPAAENAPQRPKPVAQVNGPDLADLTWDVEAPEAGGKLSQVADGSPSRCRVTYFSTRIQQTVWTSTNCLGTREDLIYVTRDGRTVITLHPALPADTWAESLAAEVTRAGEPVATLPGLRVSASANGFKTVEGKKHWLRGAVGESGPKPRLAPAGSAVVFTRTDGVMFQIDSEGQLTRVEAQPLPRPPAFSPPLSASRSDAFEAEKERAEAQAQAAVPPTNQPPPQQLSPFMKQVYANENCRTLGMCNYTMTDPKDDPNFLIKNDRNSSVIPEDEVKKRLVR